MVIGQYIYKGAVLGSEVINRLRTVSQTITNMNKSAEVRMWMVVSAPIKYNVACGQRILFAGSNVSLVDLSSS